MAPATAREPLRRLTCSTTSNRSTTGNGDIPRSATPRQKNSWMIGSELNMSRNWRHNANGLEDEKQRGRQQPENCRKEIDVLRKVVERWHSFVFLPKSGTRCNASTLRTLLQTQKSIACSLYCPSLIAHQASLQLPFTMRGAYYMRAHSASKASIDDGTSPRASIRLNASYTSVFAPALRSVSSSLNHT